MSRDELVRDLTLALLYLNSWEEDAYDYATTSRTKIRRAWRGASWEALDELRDGGLLDFANKNKSVYITQEGAREAQAVLDRLRLTPLLKEEVPKEGLPEVPALTFRLAFVFEYLTCWRVLRVPAAWGFEDLHTAIQACLGWLNYHAYDFELMDGDVRRQLSLPDPDTGGSPLADMLFLDEAGEPEWQDVRTVSLAQMFPRLRQALYSYDYGDGWMIRLDLVDAKTPLAGAVPVCVDGGGDNPPEDVGGEGGFEDFLRILSDPDDYQHAEMAEWGQFQHFEHFDLAKANARLARYEEWRAKE